MNALTGKFVLVAAMTAGLGLAGCVSGPYDHGGYQRGYGQQDQGYRGGRCQSCGVVQDVQQVYTEKSGGNGTLGAIIGAVAGGVLGNTIGKGDGRKAATVGGAVAGGVVGNQVGKRNGGNDVAWQISVRLDNGQYATVTQRDNPGVRRGDYVEVRNGMVYVR
jgi:outer membrane lipoprotein SlyB